MSKRGPSFKSLNAIYKERWMAHRQATKIKRKNYSVLQRPPQARQRARTSSGTTVADRLP
jgi:hypothetical protein